MDKDFKYKAEDLKFWREQTKDLKNKPKLKDYDNFIENEDAEDDMLELKASNGELLNFRKEFQEDVTPLPDLTLDNNSAGIDKNTIKRFKSGKMNIDGKLDMHGMTQEIAFKAFVSFVNRSFNENKRCLIIITGKGFLSKTGGVLKKSLPVWINNPEIRNKILSFSRATPKDGGSGAYYIFLKKKK